MGKLCFHRALMEPRGLPSFNSVKITRQTSPNQAPIGKRRIKTIFNHFRDKPARAGELNNCSCCCGDAFDGLFFFVS
jgi:hypothetical protein